MKTLTPTEFATFADALDPEGPGVPLAELATPAVEVLLAAATAAPVKAAYAAELRRRAAPPPQFYPDGSFAEDYEG